MVIQLALSDELHTERSTHTWRAASFWFDIPTRFGIRVMLYFMPVHRGIVIFSQRPLSSWAVDMTADRSLQLITISNVATWTSLVAIMPLLYRVFKRLYSVQMSKKTTIHLRVSSTTESAFNCSLRRGVLRCYVCVSSATSSTVSVTAS